MTAVRPVAASLGIAFGFVLAWCGMTDPDLIRSMLLLEDAYFFLAMFASVTVSFVGLRLLRAWRMRALVTRETVSWTATPLASRHVGGSMLFGAGWAMSLSCPGPIAAQLGQGLGWSLCTIAGIGVGVFAQARWQRRRRTASAAAPSVAS
jgi:hypothetical protein